MNAAFLNPAFSTKVRFYPKSKFGLINRSKLKKVRSIEDGNLSVLNEVTQRLLQEIDRRDSEGRSRSESWRLEFELESRDYMVNELFVSIGRAADLIMALNNR